MAADAAIVFLAGSARSFDELQGKDSVLYFFASWCLPCYKSMATVQQLSEQGAFKVQFVAVALDDDEQGIRRMLDKTGFKEQLWLAAQADGLLQRRSFGNERRAVPSIVRLDRQTQIIEQAYSLQAEASWRRDFH
ncbi:TlpA disulfide reductase family protein [Rheinheimera sp.]|uniref:TlpA family protein disulfide reductase n=1 Tax=Rheinheimera sp. TaxID=1869214 RepID=UPI00307D3DB7